MSREDFTPQKPFEDSSEDVPARGVLSPEESAQTSAPPSTEDPPEGLRDQLERLRSEKNDLQRTLVRLQADFDNHRKRVDRERGIENARALGGAIEGLLPALDGFERALAAHNDPAYEDFRQGFDLIYRQLREALSRLGLERIEAIGQTFDPRVHQAVERVESSEHDDGAVIDEMQAGYRFRDRVLRPAMVRVAVHPAGKPESKR